MKTIIALLPLLLGLTLPAFAADIVLTQGDTAILQMVAEDDEDGTLHDLTGAEFVTTLKGSGGVYVTISDSAHTEAPNQVTDAGEFTITLTAAQTAALEPGIGKEILTKVTQGSNIRYYRASILTVKPNFPAK